MKLLCVGDNVWDCYLSLDRMFPGGNCVNAAVSARRSGLVEVAYRGVVGDDVPGTAMRAALEAEGVGTGHLETRPGRSAYATVEVRDGERHFGPNDKGVSLFTLTEQDLALARGADLVHSSYCSRLEPQIAELASAARLSFDFDREHDPDYAVPILAHTWVAEFSAAELTPAATGELIAWAHRNGARHVLASRGGEGAVFSDGTAHYEQPAVPTEVVDTLGAGDAFIGRLLAGLLGGQPAGDAMAAAAVAAAATCTTYGGFGHGAAIPDHFLPRAVGGPAV